MTSSISFAPRRRSAFPKGTLINVVIGTGILCSLVQRASDESCGKRWPDLDGCRQPSEGYSDLLNHHNHT